MQQTVEATNLPSRTVEVAAEDLPAYINSLPRLLMADIDIKVTGTLTEFLYIHRFSGGSLSIDGNGGGISNCRIAVFSAGSTIVSIYNENRGDFSGNAAGPYVFRGGIILLGGSTPELLGGATSTKAGGLIVKADGTVL